VHNERAIILADSVNKFTTTESVRTLYYIMLLNCMFWNFRQIFKNSCVARYRMKISALRIAQNNCILLYSFETFVVIITFFPRGIYFFFFLFNEISIKQQLICKTSGDYWRQCCRKLNEFIPSFQSIVDNDDTATIAINHINIIFYIIIINTPFGRYKVYNIIIISLRLYDF